MRSELCRVVAGCVPGGRGFNSYRPRVAWQISANECWDDKEAKKDDHLPSSSGRTGRKALGVGTRMPGVRGGARGGRRRRTLSRALVASSKASKGSPESGGDRKRLGPVVVGFEASGASTPLPKEETRAAKEGGLGEAPAGGPPL